MKYVTLLILLFAMPAMGLGETPPPPESAPNLSADSAAAAFSASLSASMSKSNSTSDAVASSIAKGGDSTSGASIGDIGNTASSEGSSASTGDVIVSTKGRKNSAFTAYAGTGMNTADMLVCFSLAGQTRGAGASGIKCWLQRDLYANYRAGLHAAAGRFEASAKAQCSKPLFSADFDDVADCRASVYQSLIDQSMQAELSAVDYEQLLKDQAFEYEERLEIMSRMIDEAAGLSAKK